MLVFIDESGDTGMKLDKGSSRYFIITVLFFEDDDEALKCDKEINEIRTKLGLKKDFEFHFSEASNKIREFFLESVVKFSYFHITMVINKEALYGDGFKFKETFYKYVCGLVLENSKSILDNAKIVLDGSGSKNFRIQLASYLKKKVNTKDSKKIKDVKIQDSKKNNLIQLADMVCGAVARSFTSNAKDKNFYRKKIITKEFDVKVWPKEIDEKKKEEYKNKGK
jgi:hypothetical protein